MKKDTSKKQDEKNIDKKDDIKITWWDKLTLSHAKTEEEKIQEENEKKQLAEDKLEARKVKLEEKLTIEIKKLEDEVKKISSSKELTKKEDKKVKKLNKELTKKIALKDDSKLHIQQQVFMKNSVIVLSVIGLIALIASLIVNLAVL